MRPISPLSHWEDPRHSTSSTRIESPTNSWDSKRNQKRTRSRMQLHHEKNLIGQRSYKMSPFSWSSMQTYADFPRDRDRMIGYVNQLKWRYRIMIMPYKEHRSTEQNRLYRFLLGMISEYTWYTTDWLHEYYLEIFASTYEVRSSEMSKSVFVQYLQTVIIHAHQNLWITYPPIYEYSFTDTRDTDCTLTYDYWDCSEALSDSPETVSNYE